MESNVPPPRRSWPRRLLNRLEVDQAVFFAVAVRGWQLISGPVTILLVATFFTLPVQGFYFTFGSLLALQPFVELGLRIVILNLTSHEWSALRLDETGSITGDPDSASRLASLARTGLTWFAASALVFAVGIGAAGFVFFAQAPGQHQVEWSAPWFALVTVTALQITVIPLLAILDGCQQQRIVNRYRLGQAIAANLAAWSCILAGGGLWTAVAMTAARLTADVWVVAVRYRRFFSSLLEYRTGPHIDWQTEILPMQWRLALQAGFGWLAFYLFNPVLFHYHGAAEAGRMGLTWAGLTALQSGALAWVDTRAPLFGVLIARREFAELDRVFFRVSRVSLQLLIAGMALVVVGVYVLDLSGWYLAQRMLTAEQTALLAAGLILNTFVQHKTAYLYAHKRNPLLVVSIISHLSMGLAVWLLGSRYGATGAAFAFLGCTALIALPLWAWIFHRCRQEWHEVDFSA